MNTIAEQVEALVKKHKTTIKRIKNATSIWYELNGFTPEEMQAYAAAHGYTCELCDLYKQPGLAQFRINVSNVPLSMTLFLRSVDVKKTTPGYEIA